MKKSYPRFLLVMVSLVLILTVLALSMACSGGSKTTSAAEKELKVGIITPSTGKVSFKGIPGEHGYLDAIEYINTESGGVEGYQIKPLWFDSAYDSNTTTTAVENLKDQGALMFVTMSSTEMGYAQAIANRSEFPGMVTYTSPSNYRPPAHIYGQMPDYGDDWVAFANYYMANVWKGTGKPKMALELLNNATGYGVRDAARAKAESMGIDLVWPAEEHTATDMNMLDSMTRIKAQNPDVLFISSVDQPAYQILKAARDLGLTPNMTIGLAHATYSKTLVDTAGAELLEGVYVALPWATWDGTAAGLAKVKEYVQKNNPTDEGDANYLACWTGSMVVAEILKNAVQNAGYEVLAKGDAKAWNAIETQGIQKLSGYDVQGLQGPVTYTEGDNRLATMLKMYEIKGGVLTAVSDWVDAPVTKYEEFDWWGQ